jgi:hypothetical protein
LTPDLLADTETHIRRKRRIGDHGPATSNSDFDFLEGKWKMHHRRLNRLAGNNDWTEFDSTDENHKMLAESNMDTLSTTELPGQEGNCSKASPFALIRKHGFGGYTAPSTGVLDPPVVGSFENGVGHFSPKTHITANL